MYCFLDEQTCQRFFLLFPLTCLVNQILCITFFSVMGIQVKFPSIQMSECFSSSCSFVLYSFQSLQLALYSKIAYSFPWIQTLLSFMPRFQELSRYQWCSKGRSLTYEKDIAEEFWVFIFGYMAYICIISLSILAVSKFQSSVGVILCCDFVWDYHLNAPGKGYRVGIVMGKPGFSSQSIISR